MSAHGGSGTKYVYEGCRCSECTAANTRRIRRRRAERAAEIRLNPALATHGTQSTYSNWGCRCDPCTEANKASCREYRTGAAT